jgi:hypothetical protein
VEIEWIDMEVAGSAGLDGVQDLSSGARTSTNAQGRFVFREIKAGLQMIRTVYEGKTQEQALELEPNPETHRYIELQFKLSN